VVSRLKSEANLHIAAAVAPAVRKLLS